MEETAYRQFDRFFLEETALPEDRRAEIREVYDSLLAENDLDYRPDLHVVGASIVGPDALALPGGPILVTDSMEELAGILAHEIAHVEAKHDLRKTFR